MSEMEFESYSVEPVLAEQFSSEDTAVYDTAGSDSSESLDDVTYDWVGASGGYDFSDNFDESVNEIHDCLDNLISVNHNPRELSELGPLQTNEVTDMIEDEHDILEEMSISSEDMADFAQCASDSEASSDLFSPSQLARIKAVNDAYRACESEEVFKEEEKLEVEKLVPSESDVVLTQCASESETSSDLFTPSQLARIKAVNDAYRAWSEEMEKEAFQAMMLADLSITQYSGYGAFHANPLIPQEIEGLEPKVNGNHLIWDWLSSEKNYFEMTFYKPFTFYADVLLSEK